MKYRNVYSICCHSGVFRGCSSKTKSTSLNFGCTARFTAIVIEVELHVKTLNLRHNHVCSRQMAFAYPHIAAVGGTRRKKSAAVDAANALISETAEGNTVFSTLHLYSGLWQVEVKSTDGENTAFAVLSGLYEFETIPFGLANYPSTFYRLLNQVLSQLIANSCLVYMYDIIVLGKDFENHLANLRPEFLSLRQAGLTLKPSNRVFTRPRVKFLGLVVSANGVEIDVDKVRQIREWPTPSDVTEVRRFIGLALWCRRLIKDYANNAAPLHRLTQKEKKF
nr:unnamed protein product [Spirometra erinaceieuropaei]